MSLHHLEFYDAAMLASNRISPTAAAAAAATPTRSYLEDETVNFVVGKMVTNPLTHALTHSPNVTELLLHLSLSFNGRAALLGSTFPLASASALASSSLRETFAQEEEKVSFIHVIVYL